MRAAALAYGWVRALHEVSNEKKELGIKNEFQ
jgi:hypothetical protein